ncbi:MAG: plasma-membrane proton-efflux P-type ATPase [Sulfolobales archaeon]|jgi:H+-transporting ATPase|nr:plasma-membrane proton-efflux P-type ATPase [Sulfolobales archaeon]
MPDQITIDREKLIKATAEEVARSLSVDLGKGLNEDEAQRRLSQFGPNEIQEEKRNPAKDFVKKFWNPTAWILETAAALSYFLGKTLDFYVIIALLVFNAVLSFTQEQRANKALELLRRKLQVNARVLRDGQWKVIPARLLVPGDVIRVRLGDFVPADVKLYDGEVEVDQSALTGESLPVYRKKDDVIYSGSIVRRGEATGVVLFTGKNTYFGRTVELVKIAKPRLRIEKVVNRVVFWMMVMVAALLAASAILILVRHEDIFSFIPFSLILIVAAIPIALPAMFSISLALGSYELSREGVLITKLDAIEGAATMNVLASDKTGTITMNQLSVYDVIPINADKKEVLLYGALASSEASQDPIDIAIIEKAKEEGIKLAEWNVESFKPFDPSTRRTESEASKDGRRVRSAKGSIDSISKLCGIKSDPLYEKAEEVARKGCRVLAVAKDEGQGWVLVGLIALRDPPRPDSAELVRELKELGVKVLMITGDATPIAKEIAREVGIGERVVSLKELKESPNLVDKVDGVAEVFPEDKFTIVKILQGEGKVVGMTGDGVNDSPALRQADVGIAVSNATDVAKAAAAVVLTTPGLRNIVDMVKTGRRIYERVNIWILSRITRTFENVVFVALAYLLFDKFVISTFGMVLMLFLFDFVTLTQSTDNVPYPRSPARWDVTNLVKVASLIGSFMVVESFVPLFTFMSLPLKELQTAMFSYLLFSNIFNLLNVRERGNFWASRPSNVMIAAIALDILATLALAAHGIPGLAAVPIGVTLTALAYAVLFNLIVNNFVKVGFRRLLNLEW